jgi:hypothetical protein
MMIALLLYAYARGTRSSRIIERACSEDVAIRVTSAQQRPDHATVARFVERHQGALAGLFGQVLTLCARSGLARVGVLAVDGTKGQANASRDENLDYEQLARAIIEDAIATDAAEDERLALGVLSKPDLTVASYEVVRILRFGAIARLAGRDRAGPGRAGLRSKRDLAPARLALRLSYAQGCAGTNRGSSESNELDTARHARRSLL